MEEQRSQGMMTSLREGEGWRGLLILGVIALICALAMPPALAVTTVALSAVVLVVLGVRRARQRSATRRKQVAVELERRGLKLTSMTEQVWGGEIRFEADDGSGQRVWGVMRGDDFSIEEQKWIN